jgi:hypothetical protein
MWPISVADVRHANLGVSLCLGPFLVADAMILALLSTAQGNHHSGHW